MTICTSNTILIETGPTARQPLPASAILLAIGALMLPACAGEAADGVDEHDGATQAAALRPTGTPAQRVDRGQPQEVAEVSHVMRMKDIEQGDVPACHITFAYEDHPPETLIWSKEPCSDVSAMFLSQAELEHHRDWQRLSKYDRERFAELPNKKVLYVAGNFTASVYPLDYNHLTYEVTVSD